MGFIRFHPMPVKLATENAPQLAYRCLDRASMSLTADYYLGNTHTLHIFIGVTENASGVRMRDSEGKPKPYLRYRIVRSNEDTNDLHDTLVAALLEVPDEFGLEPLEAEVWAREEEARMAQSLRILAGANREDREFLYSDPRQARLDQDLLKASQDLWPNG